MKKIAKSLTLIMMCLILALSTVTMVSAAVDRVTTLKASSLTYNSVKLTWTAVSGANGYRLQQRIGDGKWTTVSEAITATSYTAKSLSTGSTYSYRVCAYKNVKNILGKVSKEYGKYSPTVSVKPTVAKVTNLKATTASMTSVNLTWSKVSGASGYQIVKYTDGKWTHVAYTTKTTYTVTNLKSGTTYPLGVRAYRTVGKTKMFGSYVTLKYTAGVGQVSGLKFSAYDYKSATITWNKMSGATGYQVYKYDYSNKGWKYVKKITNASTVKYTDKTLVTGTKYAYRVRAFHQANGKTTFGAFSSNIYITPKLNQVSGIKLTKIENKKATLTWTAVPGAQVYQVYDYSTGSAVRLISVRPNTATFAVQEGRSYKIRIRAYTKASGSVVYGALSNGYTTFFTTPGAPGNLEGIILENGSAKFTWDGVEGASGYNLYSFNGKNNTWVAMGTTTATSYTLRDLSKAPSANFIVRAYVNNGGTVLESDDSSVVHIKVIEAPVVTVGNCTATDIELKWNAVEGADKYTVETYNYNEDSWTMLTETTQTSYIDRGFDGRCTIFRVYASTYSGDKGIVSSPVSACTAGVSLTQNGATQTLSWPAVENAAKYRILAKQKNSNAGVYYILTEVSSTSATVCLTPDTMHSLAVYAYNAAGSYIGCAIDEIVFKTLPLTVVSPGHSYYDASVNSQLLYLVNAINNTKHETSKVTVASKSTVTYSTDMFYLGNYEIPSENIERLITLLDTFFPNVSDEDIEELRNLTLDGKEVAQETLTFQGGIAKNSQGKTVNLARFVEPADSNYAELYDWQNPSAWKNGFSSVKTTALTGGGYKFELTLKKEEFGTAVGKESAHYHPGFATTVASLSYLSSGELTNEKTSLGETTITAVVNSDGTLDSYVVNSPFSIKMMTEIDGTSVMDKFGMGLNGKIVSEYKFTR